MLHLILGGARSGKSKFALENAQNLSESLGTTVTYVATATATDEEMATRIQHHQQERPSHWHTVEVELNLADWVRNHAQGVVIIDCLTLWLNNQLFHNPQQDFKKLTHDLASALASSQANIFVVSNEVGMGVIPMGEISRQFVDQAGWLNQQIAKVSDNVTLIAAGLPLALKVKGRQRQNDH